ncbi:hypothetical protein RhiirB3_441345 [Rhizophagus irregularis]|nr:hypothetical protein RhiirB3_441345 [Rhizophagus irregularis]
MDYSDQCMDHAECSSYATRGLEMHLVLQPPKYFYNDNFVLQFWLCLVLFYTKVGSTILSRVGLLYSFESLVEYSAPIFVMLP